MKEKLEEIIKFAFPEITILKVEDASSKHAGHGHNLAKESHFEIELLGTGIPVLQKVTIHKHLTLLFQPFYDKNKVHSISIVFK